MGSEMCIRDRIRCPAVWYVRYVRCPAETRYDGKVYACAVPRSGSLCPAVRLSGYVRCPVMSGARLSGMPGARLCSVSGKGFTL